MAKITYGVNVSSYYAMAIDEVKPESFTKIIIDGVAYESQHVFDASMVIAIKGNVNFDFTGKEVFFE